MAISRHDILKGGMFMITCMGLVVGVVDSANRQDVLNKCARFLSTNRHLLDCNVSFKIDNKVYATVLDTHSNNNEFVVLFKMYDGFCTIGGV